MSREKRQRYRRDIQLGTAAVEAKVERRGVCLNEHIGHEHFVGPVRDAFLCAADRSDCRGRTRASRRTYRTRAVGLLLSFASASCFSAFR